MSVSRYFVCGLLTDIFVWAVYLDVSIWVKICEREESEPKGQGEAQPKVLHFSTVLRAN